MVTLQNINQLIAENKLEDAVRVLDEAIEENAGDDIMFLERGKLLWRLGRHADAVTDYEHALALNPDNSAAKTALDMSRDIFDFFNPDLLNP